MLSMKIFASVAVLVSLLAAVTGIKNGELDGEGHPHVGLMVALDEQGSPLWRCTGTLLSSTVFLTAGHCLESPASQITIWFDSDVENGIPSNGYPYNGETFSKTIHVHPDYNPNAFFLHDVGVAVLKKVQGKGVEKDVYGTLPYVGELDDLVAANPNAEIKFDAVGYGLQYSSPAWYVADRIRYIANPKLIQLNTPGFVGDFSVLLSNNANTGGTCFGDSGGPNFLEGTNVIPAVTSYGINANCAGTGGAYRIDTEDDLAWIGSFL